MFLLLFSCFALTTSIVGAMAGLVKGLIKDIIINACSEYLKDQFRGQTGMKEELQRLLENQSKIQAVVDFASSQKQITAEYPDLNKWLWQLRDATNDVVEVLPNPKRLEEAVQKLEKVSAGVTTFLPLLDSAKQEQKEQEVDFYKTRETGYLPKNDLIGWRKEFVMQWLRKSSNEPRTTRCTNISLLSIVGHGGMGKTTLLQHVYKDEITKEFDFQMWVCVSNNFDVKKVIADMLESLKHHRPHLETLGALQRRRVEEEVMSKKFLLVLDDIWEEDEEKDKSKWEDVLAPLASGAFGSKILVTTRTDSVALMFAKAIKKKKEIVKLEGLEEDECLQLLNSHAFAGVENYKIHDLMQELPSKIFVNECGKLSKTIQHLPVQISETIQPLSVYLLKNDHMGRRKVKEFVMQWVRKPSNEPRTTLHRNISLLSIAGHGGIGKTTLLIICLSLLAFIFFYLFDNLSEKKAHHELPT